MVFLYFANCQTQNVGRKHGILGISDVGHAGWLVAMQTRWGKLKIQVNAVCMSAGTGCTRVGQPLARKVELASTHTSYL